MSEGFLTCLQALQKDLIALAIFAIGFACTFLVQSLWAKADSRSVVDPKKVRSWPALSSGAASKARAPNVGGDKINMPASSPEVLSALQTLGAAGASKDAELLKLFRAECVRGSLGDLSSEPMLERLVLEAVLRQRRMDMLQKLVSGSASSRSLPLLRGLCDERRLEDAKWVFQGVVEKTSYHYNALLECCIRCSACWKDLAAAERIMEAATTAGLADVVTYNTLIKAFLQHNDVPRARKALDKMRASGFAPNCVTFNELLDATIRSGGNIATTWRIVDEMHASGVHPNRVTASILLKLFHTRLKPSDVERAMAIVEASSDDMDEVLLGSVIEACIRVNREDLLMRQLRRQQGEKRVQISSSHTYGSMIRAYGWVRDVKGIWAMWREMQEREILWTSVTLGNMVEALVQIGDPQAAYDLIHTSKNNAQTSPLINAVIYGSVLKGFSHQRRFDKVWSIYQEMSASSIEFSVVTYNTLVNACVMCGHMDRIPPLLVQMSEKGLEPDTVTYSAIIKGYCQEGRLDQAFELLDNMNQAAQFQPDELTYNTLIDGCARQSMWDRGFVLLDQMQNSGVAPSNFTLSVLVKLASRCKKLDRAFQLCEEISSKYGFKLNVHVYNNLIQACTHHGTIRQAIDVLTKMVREGVRPDVRTYKLLLSGCVRTSDMHMAAGLLRAAFGLSGLPFILNGCSPARLQPNERLPADVVNETLEAIARRSSDERLTIELLTALRHVQGLQLDSKLLLKLTARVMHSP